MDAGGLASLLAPCWFQSVADPAELAHAGAATWTAQDTFSSVQNAPSSPSTETNLYDWIVQFDTASMAGIASVAQTANLLAGGGVNFEVITGLGLAGMVLVRSSGASLADVTACLTHDSDVAAFEQDAVRQFEKTPNDTQYNQLWGMTKINAAGAWNTNTGSQSVVVAVIDTGIDYNHTDLAANIWTNPREIAGNTRDDDGNGFVNDIHGYDFVNNDGDPMDDNSHGTHVAGTIGAVGNNGLGVAGVNWAVSIMPLKFLNANGSGYISDAVRAVNYATMERVRYGVNVRVMSNSWGGGGFSSAMQSAILSANDAGILFVAAAGNSGTNNDISPTYPANYAPANVISVAASDQNDRLASFSCYGASTVDLAAPGVSIYSTIPGNRYAAYSGTSMATPMVSGVAALCWAVNPNATVAQVRNALLQGADRLSTLGGLVATGGRLNAYNTLQIINPVQQQGPAIASLTVSQSSVVPGATVTLVANGVAGSSFPVRSVSFYRDTNNNGQYDATDTLVGTSSSIVGGQASIQFSTNGLNSGTYRFLARVVDTSSRWSSASATLLTVLPPDDYGNTAATSTLIGVPVAKQGMLGIQGDVDWFKFQAVAGKTYIFTTQLGTLRDSILKLYDRNGTTVLATNDDYGSTLASRIQWTARTTGTYYVGVGAYGNAYTGTYTLNAQLQTTSTTGIRSLSLENPLESAASVSAVMESQAQASRASSNGCEGILAARLGVIAAWSAVDTSSSTELLSAFQTSRQSIVDAVYDRLSAVEVNSTSGIETDEAHPAPAGLDAFDEIFDLLDAIC
jgi:subtilisin family serine protease